MSKNEIEKVDHNFVLASEEMYMQVYDDINGKEKITLPIAKLSTLGAGVESLLPAFRTINQTISFDGSGLYRIANQEIGDVLKQKKDGNYWGSLKTAEGKSRMAQLQSVGTITN